eukprot:759061-Hanusia_phi.AAC.6
MIADWCVRKGEVLFKEAATFSSPRNQACPGPAWRFGRFDGGWVGGKGGVMTQGLGTTHPYPPPPPHPAEKIEIVPLHICYDPSSHQRNPSKVPVMGM